MAELLRVNGKALSGLHVRLAAVGQIWSPPGRDFGEVRIPGRMGARLITPPVGRLQLLPVTMALEATVSNRRERLDALWRRLRGLLELEVSDLTDRTYWAIRWEADTGARFPSVSFVEPSGDLQVSAVFALVEPGSVDRNARVVSFGADQEVEADPGTVEDHPVHGLWRFPGDTTNLVIQVLDGVTGEERRKLTLSGSTSGEILEIDTSVPTMEGVDATTGDRTNRMSLYSSGDFPVLRSEWGTNTSPPLVTANHAGEVSYRRAYQ